VPSPFWRTDVISTDAGAFVAPFERLPADAAPVAGGKGASLARMAGAGLPVPRGFVVCTPAFHAFLDSHGGIDLVGRVTRELDVHETAALQAASDEIRALILGHPLPREMDEAIRHGYRTLGEQLRVAVRSSAVSEDGEAASFAGQQETFLNVRGDEAVLRDVQECWASFFSPRALFYRAQKGALSDTRMAVVVQEMVIADKSGVLFTVDPIRKRRDRMVIEAVLGLGEGLVSGLITPDHYVLDRETGAILDEFFGQQESAIMDDPEHGGTRHVQLHRTAHQPLGGDNEVPRESAARILTEDELQRLRATGLRVEASFGSPQDIEWCIRGDELLLLQSRPITTL
jgi:pyruvate,water dikinase